MWSKSLEGLEEMWAQGRIETKRDGTPRLDGEKVCLDESPRKPLQNIWTDIPRIANTSRERLSYPTQKPIALLERIVRSSSNEGDTILDPFCGCGTAIAAAQKLDRRWIGIDITQLAVSLVRYRLRDSFGKDCQFDVIGEPVSLQDATALAADDTHQFELWALGLVEGRPVKPKKGADRGIDGQKNFHDEGRGGKTKKIIFSVKSGHVTVSQVRDLVGVITRERALSELQYTEKFIAFVDVLGWKFHVRGSDTGRGLSLKELCEMTDMLGKPTEREHFKKYGPTTCPQAPWIRKDLDFRITQVSDSVLISAEISPAGLINLVGHCWGACRRLLSKGIMCRGYIKRGPIYHTAEYQIGVGFSEAVEGEKQVSIFRRDADERGTPFIEVDMDVVQYVQRQSDECVKEVFSRCVETDGDLTAIFPFKGLLNFGSDDPEKDLASLNVVRGWIHRMKEHVESHIDPSNESVRQKGEQYVRMLDARLVACDRREKLIKSVMQPFPADQYTPEDYPGLF